MFGDLAFNCFCSFLVSVFGLIGFFIARSRRADKKGQIVGLVLGMLLGLVVFIAYVMYIALSPIFANP